MALSRPRVTRCVHGRLQYPFPTDCSDHTTSPTITIPTSSKRTTRRRTTLPKSPSAEPSRKVNLNVFFATTSREGEHELGEEQDKTAVIPPSSASASLFDLSPSTAHQSTPQSSRSPTPSSPQRPHEQNLQLTMEEAHNHPNITHRRTSLLNALNNTTALVNNLRTRLEISRSDDLRHKALTDQAREERDAAVKQRRDAESRFKKLLIAVAVVFMAWMVLTLRNGNDVDREYVRGRYKALYGLL